MKHYLGIDIGGTAVKLGIVNEAGAVLAKAEESVSFDGYRTPILTTVLKAAQAFLAAQNIPAESLAGIGVSAAACPTTSAHPSRRSWKRPLVCRSR